MEEHTALRHQRILEVGSEGTGDTESERDYAAWKKRRTDLLSKASQPSISVQTVTAIARLEAPKTLADLPHVQVGGSQQRVFAT